MIVDVCSKVGVVIKVSAVIDERLHKSVSVETGVSMLNWKFAEKKCVCVRRSVQIIAEREVFPCQLLVRLDNWREKCEKKCSMTLGKCEAEASLAQNWLFRASGRS